jgi:hypothetical protein
VKAVNVSAIVATVIDAGRATLHELETVYGLEGLWDLFEIYAVAQQNEYLAAKRANRQQR